MNSTFHQFKIHLSPGGGQRKTVAGVNYAVYPSVILVEGVHHGAIGEPTFYPAEVLQASAPAWNGQPVTIGHPQDAQGAYVSAGSKPDGHIGRLTNVMYGAGKLRAEVMLTVAKAHQHRPGLLNALDSGAMMDVSTGLFGQEVRESGIWNGEAYQTRLTAIQPDHLALLPGGAGACSWADGCGIRANEEIYVPAAIRFNNYKGDSIMAEEALTVPRLFEGVQHNSSPVDRAIAHLKATHGAMATGMIRNMSGAQLLMLGEKLAGKQQQAARPGAGDEEALTMPTFDFGGGR